MALTKNEALELVNALTLRVEELEAILNPVAILAQEDTPMDRDWETNR